MEEVLVENILIEEKEYAGFWRRAAANFLDALIISMPLGLILALIMTGNAFTTSEPDQLPMMHENISTLLFTLYGLLLPIFWVGFTVGKKIMKVQIRRVDGHPITIWTMLMRNVVAGLVYVFTIGIALIVSGFMVALRKDKRSLHDLIAKTEVIKINE